MSSINLQESQLSGCATYVAIVVDESGSINGNEAQQIRDGLTSFINSQAQSNITLSLIGMSNSDTAVRPDNVIQKKISSNSQDFIDWISLYGLGNQSIQSDYWASGLNVAKNLSVTPDIVFVVTDGLQVNNSEYLKNLFTELNLTSKVFVYGVTSSFDTIEELTTPLTNFLERTPVLKNDQTSALDSDYIRVPDFSTLGIELNRLATNLSDLQIGCFPNVSIIDDNLVYPSLKKGLKISAQCGTLVLKNKSRVPLTLSAGTKIHNEKNLNGLTFKLDNSVTISGKDEVEVPIRIEGKPLSFGHFSTLVDLSDVFNPLGVSINFNVGRESSTIEITPGKTNLQSTYLQVVTAGSRGIDSTKGIHLRWMLNGKLGENHLPKGELYDGENSNSSFNKPDDFVKVYRAPYTKISQTVDLTQNPNVVDNKKALWIYKTVNPQRSVYINFKDDKKYKSIKLSIDPLTNPVAFMQAYGNGLIEIETKTDLFFAAELDFSSSNTSKSVKLETLSVAENKITASKNVSSRKTYTSAQLNNKIRVVAENGRSIRFKADYCLLNAIQFEFYSDFITNANTNGDWILKGKYGLDTDDFKVFEQLEPKLNAVHGKWLKFNDGEYVNTKNYKAKWNRPTVENDITDENIKDIVLEYIDLSKSGNPKAEKDIHFGDRIPVNEPKEGEVQQYAENLTKISYLDILNIAANDYHVARMLGLGCLDLDEEVYDGEYVYLTEYTTFGSLEEGIEGKEMQHLSMSIPTSINTERMPLPVQLSKIVPGLNVNSDENPNNRITDPEGYSFDGKKRFVSLFMDDVMDYDTVNPNSKNDFFKSSLEYDGSAFTFPIYLGIDHKIATKPTWKTPELSHDIEYKSVNQNLKESEFETVPINIPEAGKSVLNAIQEQTGENTYIYQAYGINIFSRATSGRQISIKSDIKPANNLMPPSNMNALLVTEENPLMFTSQSEQQLLGKITGADKTLIRIMFDYYSAQELLSYPVPREMTVTDAETDKESIFPDDKEILADHFKLYHKDGLPEVEYGEIESIVNNSTNNLTSIVKIREYRIISSDQQVKLGLDNSNKTRFERGVLTIGDQNYIIQNIEVKFKKDENSNDVFDYALIEVLKKEVTDKLHADGDATIDSEQIQDIKLPESRLCTLVQNMQTASNWHQPQIDFTVQYPESLNKIHREVIEHISQNGRDLQLEKTRGVWNDVVVERVFENSYEMNENGTYKVDDEGNPIPLLSEKKHLGLYKIIFKNFNLPQHFQFKSEKENSVEWSNGIVRLFTKDAFEEGNPVPKKSRKEFKVYKTENIGTTGDLVLYIDDPDFKLGNYVTQTMAEGYDEILGAKNGLHTENGVSDYENDYVSQSANYYPSYKVYLYADAVSGITQENILPRENENTHYSVFGVSTHSKTDVCYKSKISIPCPMYAVKVEKTEKPEEIIGGSLYATRPDFYNRSTFTFTTKYDDSRKPYGLLHYRANDEDLLNVLYKPETVTTIREELNKLGGNDEIDFNDRWADFLNFNELATRGQYDVFPKNESEENYQFPLPDNAEFIKLINDFIEWHNQTQGTQESTITSIASLNQVLISQAVQEPMLAVYFIEQAVHNAFVPLTEVPVIYEHIKGNNYVPVNKKQTIKDKNGNALKPTDTDFDIAPMMKVVNESQNRVQFTDFNLDGNSQNIYFYAVREMDIKMNFGEFSDLLGPVKLVASTPPKTPEIKRIMPILENQVLGIKPTVQIELNAYQPEYKIRKINIYRATTMLEAQSIRTMKLAKEIVINEDTLSADFDNVWTVYDDFQDLEEVPFGDGLFYRITVSKQIEYADPESTTENPIINIDYTPSQPSKITATVIVDSVSPESPVLEASATVSGTNGEILKPVVFNWNKTVYNGKYHLYKMNSQGNWDKIHEISTNLENIALPLQQTKLNTDELIIKNEDGDRIYHHFKVISENTSGMLNSDEKILTL